MLKSSFSSTMRPRAVAGPVFANGRRSPLLHADGSTKSTQEVLEEINAGVVQMKSNHEDRLNSMETFLDSVAKNMQLNGITAGTIHKDDPEYSAVFASYFKSGSNEDAVREANATGDRKMVNAALTTGTDSDGGYLAPIEWDRRIRLALKTISPIRALSDVQETAVGAYSTLWMTTGFGSGWVGETAARPATTTPQFTPLVFGHGEIYANPACSQRMIDDAAFNMEQWLANEVADEFAKQESIAFLSGDGVNKPYGILLYATGGTHASQHPAGAIQVDPSGAASSLTVDGLIDFTYKLPAPYRQNSSWLMNSMTAAAIAKMKDGQGNLIWRESLIVGQPSTLLGRPVELDENMPNILANNTPIIFGDFRSGYLINDRRPGTRVLRDPYTNKPYVHFYTTRRVGGGVQDPKALRILKIAVA